MIIPNWNHFMLGLIVLIRTVISYFLNKEITNRYVISEQDEKQFDQKVLGQLNETLANN